MSLPVDVTGIISRGLARDRREHDALLHASSDIVGPLRHTQLAFANAPTLPRSLTADIRMLVGTLLHEWLEHQFKREGVVALSEIDVTPWMPPGWGGRCDWLIYNPATQRYRPMDVKTVRGDAIKWQIKEGAKPEHIHQVSSYYHACVQGGLPLEDECTIFYWPITDTEAKPLPYEAHFTPLPKAELGDLMSSRREAAEAYVASLPPMALAMAGQILGENDWTPDAEAIDYPALFHTDKLADIHPREQVLHRNNKAGTYDLKSKPHWSSMFCPYPGSLCGCRNQAGVTKIGTYKPEGQGWLYVPRQGFEDVKPEKEPES